jgi:hypothetical protein
MRVWALILAAAWLTGANAADTRPYWSIEAKGGRFTSELEDWDTYYGDDRSEHFALAAAFKPLRFVDIGVEAARIHDRGTGQLPLNGTTSGDVTFEFYPAHAYATFRALFSERQWIVPYVGGGWTRMYYKSRVSGESTREGSVDGRHVRAGVQLLLDPLSRVDAANLRRAGIEHSHLILEGQRITAKDSATGLDVGGTTATIGLLLEY